MDVSNLGYTKPLYILPFDHRAFFARSLFNFKTTDELDGEQREQVKEFKMLIYKGFKDAVENGVSKEYGAILCDEEFGSEVLIDAKHNGFITILTVEKSGIEDFEFRYSDFEDHISRFKPEFIKVLINYRSDDKNLIQRQKEKLKTISGYSHDNNYKFLLEVLVNPTPEQLAKNNQNREDFDENSRPDLTVEMVKDYQSFGIEPDAWKLEGFDAKDAYEKIVNAIKDQGRKNVSLVILGRSESENKVEEWLKIGSKVNGVIGFAIGRTVFWEELQKFYKGEIGKAEVIQKVSKNYQNFCKIFAS